jgi:hypothetical protein
VIDEALAAEAFWPHIGDQPEISALTFGKTPGVGFFFDRKVDEDVHVAIETVVSARSFLDLSVSHLCHRPIDSGHVTTHPSSLFTASFSGGSDFCTVSHSSVSLTRQ